jgi:XTP/dITP diphosphohydrolase
MDIVLASNNKHKLAEARDILKDYNIISLKQIGFDFEIDESGSTIEENALIKARAVRKYTDKMIIADDTGLFVQALNNAPGVYSARYAGEDATFDDNNSKLLKALKGVSNRTAEFRCAIALSVPGEEEKIFIGQVMGSIADSYAGKSGFGYDPVFIPQGSDKTYAELSGEEKDRISHRAEALIELDRYLKTLAQAVK